MFGLRSSSDSRTDIWRIQFICGQLTRSQTLSSPGPIFTVLTFLPFEWLYCSKASGPTADKMAILVTSGFSISSFAGTYNLEHWAHFPSFQKGSLEATGIREAWNLAPFCFVDPTIPLFDTMLHTANTWYSGSHVYLSSLTKAGLVEYVASHILVNSKLGYINRLPLWEYVAKLITCLTMNFPLEATTT